MNHKKLLYTMIIFLIVQLLFVLVGNHLNHSSDIASLDEMRKIIQHYSPFIDMDTNERFDRAISEAKRNLKKCNNDFDVYLLFRESLSVVKDSHSQILFASKTQEIGQLPIMIQDVDGSLVVEKVYKENLKFLVGKKIVSVNDDSLDVFLYNMIKYSNTMDKRVSRDQIIQLMHYGDIGGSSNFTFLDENGKEFHFQLYYSKPFKETMSDVTTHYLYSDRSISLSIKGDAAILTINEFGEKNFAITLRKKILPLIPEHCNHLIVDVRESRGGNGYNALTLLRTISSHQKYHSYEVEVRKNSIDLLTLSESNRNEIMSREQYIALIERNNSTSADYYENVLLTKQNVIELPNIETIKNFQKITVLCSQHTISASEDFVYYAKQNPNVTVVGERTAGSTGHAVQFDLSNGSKLLLTIYKCKDSGKEINNTGIVPDIPIDIWLDKNKHLTEVLK